MLFRCRNRLLYSSLSSGIGYPTADETNLMEGDMPVEVEKLHDNYKKKDKYVSNRYIHEYVARLQPFENHKGTCFGHWETKFVYEPVTGQLSHTVNIGYAVFSYGSHFPIYFYDKRSDQWFGNKDKYSRTTSRHQSQARPASVEDIKWVDTDMLKQLVKYGCIDALANRIIG